MTKDKSILVKNVYYMLAYAFQVLNEDSYASIETEKFEYVGDLFAAILAKGIANQIKRGLGREYITNTDELSSPHGKIDISSSIKQRTTLKKQLVCKFDDFSENAYMNQILKTTSWLLIRSPNVAGQQKRALKKVMLYFENVDTIDPRHVQWQAVRYNRNNATYKMLINICYLVISGLLLTTEDGQRKLSRFVDDQRMHRLYEKFILEYYRKEFPGFKAKASQIDWLLDDDSRKMLPIMQTDIMLLHGEKTLIIDAKYYNRTMQSRENYNSATIHSNNLYQIFAYVKNKDAERTGNVSGMLLYAKTDEEITPKQEYSMSGNKITVRTLDLSGDFDLIKLQLNKIAEWWI